MIDITDRLVTLLGLETLREKQEAEKCALSVENELAKNEPIMESTSIF
jgi:hypothetical protein